MSHNDTPPSHNDTHLMITRSVLCPAEVPSGIKLPNLSSQSTEFHHLFFATHLLALLKAIECSTGPPGRTNISKLNFASGRTGKTAGPASNKLAKLSLKNNDYSEATMTQLAKNFHLKRFYTSDRNPPFMVFL